jgi:pimeloyl-ACP methyl ester carboxylesterase
MKLFFLSLCTLALGACASTPQATGGDASPPPKSVTLEAGFLEVPARKVTVKGTPVAIEATGRLFYNLRPADESPTTKPIFILFNGFADDIVRAYGTGPTTVAPDGRVVPNPSSLTSLANLVYVEPRQAGYSYDVLRGRAPDAGDCAPQVFNEYVDAADVLLAVLTFLEDHPELEGPVYWLGESYAGVRVTWILTYLRGRWENVPYSDPLLASRLEGVHRSGSLMAGQILLEAWLAGGAETTAITTVCDGKAETQAVGASIGESCQEMDARTCATNAGRSLYNYTYTLEHETTRETFADAAHTEPSLAALLLGLPLSDIPLLAQKERSLGFKCSSADDTVPSETNLVALLGALPGGQSYYLPYSPLQPGKELAKTTADWSTRDYEAVAFADNLRDIPAFLTQGDRDLVVPTKALAPALRAVLGASRVDDASLARLGLVYPDGERYVDIFEYASAGHMISMVEPAKLAKDIAGWLPGSAK